MCSWEFAPFLRPSQIQLARKESNAPAWKYALELSLTGGINENFPRNSSFCPMIVIEMGSLVNIDIPRVMILLVPLAIRCSESGKTSYQQGSVGTVPWGQIEGILHDNLSIKISDSDLGTS